MDSVPLANERVKLFKYSTGVVRDHSSFSQSIAASALGIRHPKDRMTYFQHNSNNLFHSQELTGIPHTVNVDPTNNTDLRIVDLLDSGFPHPFLRFEQISRTSSSGCAVDLFHGLKTSYSIKNHFGVSPPDSQTISFSNRSNMKSLRDEVMNDGLTYSDRLYVMPEQEIEPLPESKYESKPTIPVFIQESSNRVPPELINLISPNSSS